MEKRHFNRKRCLATAVAAAALTGFAYNADAALRLELTQSGQTPNGAAETLNISNLNALTLDVWATVTGANGTSADDGLQIAGMSFTSTGDITGNFTSAGPTGPGLVWQSNGWQPGTQYGTAGDLDLGSTNPAIAAGHWLAISDEVQSGTGVSSNGSGSFLLGSVTFTPTAANSGQTAALNLVPRASNNGQLWFEDSTITDPGGGAPLKWTNPKDPSNGTVTNFGLNLSFAGVAGTPNLWATAGTGAWGTGANWDDGIVPAPGASVTFAATSVGANVPVVVDGGGRSVGGITFNNNASSFNIGGSDTLTINNGAVLDVQAGNHVISAPVAYGGAVSKAGVGGLTVNNVRTPGQLAVTGGKLTIATSGNTNNNTSKVGVLTITGAGSKLDLGDSDLVVDYTGASVAGNVRTMLSSGYAAGAWTGDGIMSSLAVGDKSIGYGEASFVKGIAGAATADFSGQTVDATSILVKFTYAGDANIDGKVDVGDLGLLAGNWNQPSGKVWTDGDVTYDGAVNIGDLGLLAGNWNKGVSIGPVLGPSVDGVSAVPEPGSLGLLAIAGASLLRRRRNR